MRLRGAFLLIVLILSIITPHYSISLSLGGRRSIFSNAISNILARNFRTAIKKGLASSNPEKRAAASAMKRNFERKGISLKHKPYRPPTPTPTPNLPAVVKANPQIIPSVSSQVKTIIHETAKERALKKRTSYAEEVINLLDAGSKSNVLTLLKDFVDPKFSTSFDLGNLIELSERPQEYFDQLLQEKGKTYLALKVIKLTNDKVKFTEENVAQIARDPKQFIKNFIQRAEKALPWHNLIAKIRIKFVNGLGELGSMTPDQIQEYIKVKGIAYFRDQVKSVSGLSSVSESQAYEVAQNPQKFVEQRMDALKLRPLREGMDNMNKQHSDIMAIQTLYELSRKSPEYYKDYLTRTSVTHLIAEIQDVTEGRVQLSSADIWAMTKDPPGFFQSWVQKEGLEKMAEETLQLTQRKYSDALAAQNIYEASQTEPSQLRQMADMGLAYCSQKLGEMTNGRVRITSENIAQFKADPKNFIKSFVIKNADYYMAKKMRGVVGKKYDQIMAARSFAIMLKAPEKGLKLLFKGPGPKTYLAKKLNKLTGGRISINSDHVNGFIENPKSFIKNTLKLQGLYQISKKLSNFTDGKYDSILTPENLRKLATKPKEFAIDMMKTKGLEYLSGKMNELFENQAQGKYKYFTPDLLTQLAKNPKAAMKNFIKSKGKRFIETKVKELLTNKVGGKILNTFGGIDGVTNLIKDPKKFLKENVMNIVKSKAKKFFKKKILSSVSKFLIKKGLSSTLLSSASGVLTGGLGTVAAIGYQLFKAWKDKYPRAYAKVKKVLKMTGVYQLHKAVKKVYNKVKKIGKKIVKKFKRFFRW